MNIDDVFLHVGEFGVFQVLACTLLMFTAFLATEVFELDFVNYEMDHWCSTNSELSALPYEIQKYVSIPAQAGSEDVYSQCRMYNLTYSQYSESDYQYWNRNTDSLNASTIPCKDWQYDFSLFGQNGISKWNLVCNDAWKVDFAGSVVIVGILFGSLLNGIIAERLGRRRTLLCFIFIKLSGAVLYTLAPYWALFITGRFLNGAGSLGLYLAGFVMVVDYVGASYRDIMIVGMTISYSFGFMMIPLQAYFVRDGLLFQLVHTAPCLLFVTFYWILPESPRWLFLVDRRDEALQVFQKIAKINRKQLPKDFDINEVEFNTTKNSSASFIDLVRTPVIRKNSLILFANWFTMSLLYYGLSLNAGKLSGDVFLNTFLMAAVEVPAIALSMWLTRVPRIGRKYSNVLAVAGAGVACLICIPFIILNKYTWLVTALSLVGKAGSAMGFAIMYLYTAELYPTELRNLGMSACSIVARLSGIAAPYVGGMLATWWRPIPNIAYGVCGVIAGLLTLWLKETLNTKLPDSIAEIESETLEDERDLINKHLINQSSCSDDDLLDA